MKRSGLSPAQSLKDTLVNLQDIGYLQVKILRAADLTSTDLNGTHGAKKIMNVS